MSREAAHKATLFPLLPVFPQDFANLPEVEIKFDRGVQLKLPVGKSPVQTSLSCLFLRKKKILNKYVCHFSFLFPDILFLFHCLILHSLSAGLFFKLEVDQPS